MKKKLLNMSLAALILGCTMNAAQAQWNIAGSNINNTNTGNVGIGTGTGTLPAKLTVQGSGSVPATSWVSAGAPIFAGFGEQIVGNSDYILSMASTLSNARPVFIGRRSKGTLAAPIKVINNDYLMSFLASGYDGSAFQNPAAIDFYADGTPTAGNVPARISFVTGTNGTTRAERLKIGNTGDITMNTNQFFLQKSNGNVGIGTITPTENVVVSEPAGAVAGTQNFLCVETVINPFVASNQGILIRKDDGQKRGFKLYQDGSDDGNSVFKIASFSGGSDIDRLTIKRDNGNVGIGTIAPAAKLDIAGNIKITDGTQGTGKVLTSDASGLASWQAPSGSGSNWTLSGIDIFNNNSGNVGIGTSTPTENVVVSEPAGAVAGTQNFLCVETVVNPFVPSNQGILIRKDDGQKRGFKLFQDGSDDGNSVFKIASFSGGSDIDRLTIKRDNGNVGIGTTTPTENLVVSEPAGAVAGTQNFLLVETVVNPFVASNQGILLRKDDGQKRGFKLYQDGSDDANSVFKIASFSGGGDIDRLTIKRDNGNVGIGTTAPTANLSVNGTANNTTGAWGVFSDSRVKKVNADFTDGLNVIKQIRTIKFNYNEKAPFNAEGEQIGVVAQELEKVAPYMVSKKAMGDIKDLREVNNQAYPFLLINAVKELAAANDKLTAANDAKDAAITELQKEVAAIKSMLQGGNAKNIAAINQQEVNFETAYLEQNVPNPPAGNFTKINYNIPTGAARAEMVIVDNAGRKIKTIGLNTFGKGVLNVDTKGLPTGTYSYSMMVDGKVIDTKQMVVVK